MIKTFSGLRIAGLLVAGLLIAGLLASCSQTPVTRDADVIVVGAGIAGLSAALEASDNGARVLLLDVNSVGGGHAVKAGGFALVDTALQRSRGIQDSPQLAVADWTAYGVDPDPLWTNRYAEASSAEVYDWLTEHGTAFRMLLPTPQDSVPRFHFTQGAAVNAVVPLLRAMLYDTNIEFRWNTRVVALARSGGRINGVLARDERDGSEHLFRSNSVILATGGLQNNLQQVLENWSADIEQPDSLFRGAGKFATGDGHRLASWAGADLVNMDRQVIFYNGVPNPRDTTENKALLTQNPRAIWVNAAGHRFMNEKAGDKAVAQAMSDNPTPGYWMIFDAEGAKRLTMRDAPWLNRDTVATEILHNPMVATSADNLKQLARRTGLPEHGLRATVQTWNRMVDVGEDFKFGRFSKQNPDRNAIPVSKAPFYAIRTRPMTRKNLGGPAINSSAQALDASGKPVAGLYAAGELTGVAGINGRYGGAGTFLGPSVYTGRIAGAAAARMSSPALAYRKLTAVKYTEAPRPGADGYWHFDVAHKLVSERGYSCTQCHSDTNPMQPASERAVLLARLDTCNTCH